MKPSVVLGWPARTAASLAGMSERSVQAWRASDYYTPQLRLPKDAPLGWGPYVEAKRFYGVADCLALRTLHDIREAGCPLKAAQAIATEIGQWGDFGADRDGHLSVGRLGETDYLLYVPIDRYVVKRWLEKCEDGGSYLSFFDEEGMTGQHERFQKDYGYTVPTDLVLFFPIAEAAKEVSERVWKWKEQNVDSRRLLAPWLSPDIEQEIEESVQRSVAYA